ncbi:MAG: hypothetical protein OEV40_09750 [Acidimicrobiia bacterium]|nr:hypothetical protein [Acidimicrobiia bacterium]
MGTTVLVSSHQLAEVQQACDHLVVLDKGRLIASGTTREILAAHNTGRYTARLSTRPRSTPPSNLFVNCR